VVRGLGRQREPAVIASRRWRQKFSRKQQQSDSPWAVDRYDKVRYALSRIPRRKISPWARLSPAFASGDRMRSLIDRPQYLHMQIAFASSAVVAAGCGGDFRRSQ